MISLAQTNRDRDRCGSREGRIRTAIGAIDQRLLPEVGHQFLLKYHQYLLLQLAFPFEARHYGDLGSAVRTVEVLGLSALQDDGVDLTVGLLCIARCDGQEVALPLVDLELAESDANFQLVEDYWYWFWNWQRLTRNARPDRPR
jgi:hypothetical protein